MIFTLAPEYLMASARGLWQVTDSGHARVRPEPQVDEQHRAARQQRQEHPPRKGNEHANSQKIDVQIVKVSLQLCIHTQQDDHI